MKHPLWILNSALLLFLFISAGFIIITWDVVPLKSTNKKNKTTPTPHKEITVIDTSKIYTNDLFDTYIEHTTPVKEEQFLPPPLPSPPSPSKVTIPEEPVIPFLPPLPVTLKGIMVVNDESKNVIVIEDNATKKEENYKIGDSIEDAQLIRILHNKAILVRSNGQFETLYLKEEDINLQPATAAQKEGWKNVVVREDETKFKLNPIAFTEIIPGLSQCIDMLDLITIYRKGKSVGCRVGHVTPGSLPEALGLQSQDILLSVAGIPTTTPDNRFEIYEQLIQLKISDSFTVEIDRNGTTISYLFVLTDLSNSHQNDVTINSSDQKKNKKESAKGEIIKGLTPIELEEEKKAMLADRYKFAETTQDLLLEQRHHMYEHKKSEITVSPLNKAPNP